MRVVRLADACVVVCIRRRNEVLVAVPARLSESDILAMASLMLTDEEYAELTGSLGRAREPPQGSLVQRRTDVGSVSRMIDALPRPGSERPRSLTVYKRR